MSTYQCSVCFYICDLNLEVIENFQATICPWKFPKIHTGIFGRMVSAQDCLVPDFDYVQFSVTENSWALVTRFGQKILEHVTQRIVIPGDKSVCCSENKLGMRTVILRRND